MNIRNTRFFVAAAVGILVLAAPALRADDGKALYDQKCAACHAPDGSGNNPMGKKLNVKDLRSAEVQKQSDAELTAPIAKGTKGMPPYEKSLTADQIKSLVAYIRSLAKK